MSDDDDKVTLARVYRHSDAPPMGRKRSMIEKREDDDDDDDDDEDDDDNDNDNGDSSDSSDSETSRLTYVGTIAKWYGAKVPDDDSPVKFSWVVQNVTPGRYHIQMEEKEVKDENKVDNGDSDDDVTRSHVFTILPGNANSCPVNSATSVTSASSTMPNNVYPNPSLQETPSTSANIQQQPGSDPAPVVGGQTASDGQPGYGPGTVYPVPEPSDPYAAASQPSVPPQSLPASQDSAPQQPVADVQQISTSGQGSQAPTVAQNVLSSVPLPVTNKQIVKRRIQKAALRERR
ncbi:hypothetical protein BX666DRAFT_1881574 [Dichotomocladium elegans]|nr:hypothetical protein BX666DRAFT_1881574 [Dichotomocladium elegans]